MAGSLLDPGPTLVRAEELRQKRGSRGLLEAVGTPLSYAPNPVVSAIGSGLLGARYLTGEKPPEEGLLNLSNMTAMMVGSRLPEPLRHIVNTSYRGLHQAPTEGAPAHDLTGSGKVYPDDVYGPNGILYYGHYGQNNPMDSQTFGLLHQVKGRPNAPVTIYRAVPYEPTVDEQIAKLEKQKAQYMARGTTPPDWAGKGFYDHVTGELERLKSLPRAQPEKLTINPGDWVTVNRAYAKEHGESALQGSYKIISKKVRAKDIFTNGDSIHEWGYSPSE